LTVLHLAYCYELSFFLSWIIIIILILFIRSLNGLLQHRRPRIIFQILYHSYNWYIMLRVGRKCLISLMRLFWSDWCIDIWSWIQVDIIKMNGSSWFFFLLWSRFIWWLEKGTTFPPLDLRLSTRATLILFKAGTWTYALSLDHHLPIKYLFIGFIS